MSSLMHLVDVSFQVFVTFALQVILLLCPTKPKIGALVFLGTVVVVVEVVLWLVFGSWLTLALTVTGVWMLWKAVQAYKRGVAQRYTRARAAMTHLYTDPQEEDTVRIVCISDTHDEHFDMTIPDGDVLVHTGDWTRVGKPEHIAKFNEWLGTLPHPHKVVIPGNHDVFMDQENYEDLWPIWHKQRLTLEDAPVDVTPKSLRDLLSNATALLMGDEEEPTMVAGLRFWGSPWTAVIGHHAMAFQCKRGPHDLGRHFDHMPHDVDVVLSHGPPKGVLDRTFFGLMVGSTGLREALLRTKPRYFVCGHIHEAYGVSRLGDTICVNAASCDAQHRTTQAPVVIDVKVKH